MKVPPFTAYFPSREEMSADQQRFFQAWEKDWENGVARDVQGQVSYLFCHLYAVLEKPARQRLEELQKLAAAYQQEGRVADYCHHWISDTYVLAGDLGEALEWLPKPALGGRASASTDSILTLKLYLHKPVEGRDALTLFGPKVTQFGLEHLSEIATCLDMLLESRQCGSERPLLATWTEGTHTYPYFVFSGSSVLQKSNLTAYSFSHNSGVEEFVKSISREAENTFREECGIPGVGEGWVAETQLFRYLKEHLPGVEVIHHARPKWLRRQHLDIFLPEVGIAVEYQGRQHLEPVSFFGGEKAYEQTRRRDRRKKALCSRLEVLLLYAYEHTSPEDILEEIRREMELRRARSQ